MRLESVTWVLGEVIVNTFVLIRNLDKQIWTGLGQKDHCVGPIFDRFRKIKCRRQNYKNMENVFKSSS